MIGLDHLIKRPGVIAAGQFTEDGKPIRSVGKLTEPMILMASKVARNNYRLFSNQINEFRERTGEGCKNVNGWGFWCDKYALCAIGRTVVFLKMEKADFNQLIVDLYDEGPTGDRQMNY